MLGLDLPTNAAPPHYDKPESSCCQILTSQRCGCSATAHHCLFCQKSLSLGFQFEWGILIKHRKALASDASNPYLDRPLCTCVCSKLSSLVGPLQLVHKYLLLLLQLWMMISGHQRRRNRSFSITPSRCINGRCGTRDLS